MLPTKFRFTWPISFREDFLISPNQKQESPVAAMFETDRDEMSNRYREPSIDASYLVSDHLAKRLQKRRSLDIDQSEKTIACGVHIC